MSEIKKIEIRLDVMAENNEAFHLTCPQCETFATHRRLRVIGPVAYPCPGCGVPWMGDKDIRRGVAVFWPPVQVDGLWLPDVSPFILEPLEPAPPTADDVARLWDRCAESWKDAAVICGQEGDPASAATSAAYSLQAQAMAADTRYRHAQLEENKARQEKVISTLLPMPGDVERKGGGER